MLFYLASRISQTLSMLMLPREMTGFKGKINFTIGQSIALNDIEKVPLGRCEKAQMIRRHLRRVGLGKRQFLIHLKVSFIR